MEPHESLLLVLGNHEAEARHLIPHEVADIPVPGLMRDEEPAFQEYCTAFQLIYFRHNVHSTGMDQGTQSDGLSEWYTNSPSHVQRPTTVECMVHRYNTYFSMEPTSLRAAYDYILPY
jgi:hypothetical protein